MKKCISLILIFSALLIGCQNRDIANEINQENETNEKNLTLEETIDTINAENYPEVSEIVILKTREYLSGKSVQWVQETLEDEHLLDVILSDGFWVENMDDTTSLKNQVEVLENQLIDSEVSEWHKSQTKEEDRQDKTNENTNEEQVLAKLEIVKVKIVDSKGYPVIGLTVDNPVENLYSDIDGLIYADVRLDNKVTVLNTLTGEKNEYVVNQDEVKVTWLGETPRQSIQYWKEKAEFVVLDQNNNPVSAAEFRFSDQRFILPTDANGQTYYIEYPCKDNYVDILFTDYNGGYKEERFWVSISQDELSNNDKKVFKVNR